MPLNLPTISDPTSTMRSSVMTNQCTVRGNRAEERGQHAEYLEKHLWNLWSATATAFPDRDALVSMWQPTHRVGEFEHLHLAPAADVREQRYVRWSYSRLHQEAESVATWLESLGCFPGQKLVAMLWNSAEWAVFLWAAMRLRMVFMPLDPRSLHEMPALMAKLDPLVLVAEDETVAASVDALDMQLKSTVIKVHCSANAMQGWRSIAASYDLSSQTTGIGEGSPTQRHESNVASETLAMLILTSGTTGTPKLCPHTHRNLMSQACEYDPKPQDPMERWLVHTPVSHIFAINNALRAWKEGGTVVFASKSFDVEATLKALILEKCTIMSATPTLIKSLVSHPNFRSQQIHLDLVTIGGTLITHEDVRLCRDKLGATHAIQAYGMTEGAPLVSWRRHDQLLQNGYHPGVGRVLPGTVVRICRPGSEEILNTGQAGELHVSGSSVISNYFEAEDGSTSFYSDDGSIWFRTGDQGFLDKDGIVHLLGRFKDLIIRGGENIQPSRIEKVLSEVPGLQVR